MDRSSLTVGDVRPLLAATKVAMQPVVFEGCFGWLHSQPAVPPADVAVVLCQGMRVDALRGHRSFRLLADALAAAGYPTLRFDYPGTGDSSEVGAVEHWQAWQDSIHEAADWMREHTGAQRIVLCGLRLGATLAALVAERRTDVAGLVMLAPILRGRSWMIELTTEAKLRQASADGSDGLELHEFRFTGETVRRIGEVDLRRIALPPGSKVAVFAPTRSAVLSDCIASWTTLGANVAYLGFSGLGAVLRPTFQSHAASAEVARIVGWIGTACPPARDPGPAAPIPPQARLRLDGCVEEVVRFGPQAGLIGVLCRPADGVEAGLAVVICNAGGDPHYGTARFNVTLARQLAAAGFASLRMDFAGLGDSRAVDDAATHVFETDRLSDLAAAIDMLEGRGYAQFALQGVCAGAYHALHAALADARVGLLLLLNLPVFEWRAEVPVELLSHIAHGPGILLPALFHRDFWRSLRDGPLSLGEHVVVQRVWLAGKVQAVARLLPAWLRWMLPPNFAEDSMRRLSGQTRTLFLVSEGDVAAGTLARVFGRNRNPPGSTIRIVPGLDHSVTGAEMQRVATGLMVGFIEQNRVSLNS